MIKYEMSSDNANREAKLIEYLGFLSTSEDLINSQSAYEAFFFIGKFCTIKLTETAQQMFLETKCVQMFIRTLQSLFEKRGELKFDESASVEVGNAPKSDESNFKESIFSYTLSSFNILCKDLVRDVFFLQSCACECLQLPPPCPWNSADMSGLTMHVHNLA